MRCAAGERGRERHRCRWDGIAAGRWQHYCRGRRHCCLAASLPGEVCVLLTECACVLAGSACLPGSRWQVGWGVNGVGMGQGWDGDRDGDRDRERERESPHAACVRAGAATGSASCKPRAASLTVVSTSAGIFVRRGARVRTGKHSTGYLPANGARRLRPPTQESQMRRCDAQSRPHTRA